MGIIKSLFGGKKDEPKLKVEFHTNINQDEDAPLKKVSASVQELVMLCMADNFMVGQKKYAGYLRSRYGIGFPNEVLKNWRKGTS